jgi:hypothetical protein
MSLLPSPSQIIQAQQKYDKSIVDPEVETMSKALLQWVNQIDFSKTELQYQSFSSISRVNCMGALSKNQAVIDVSKSSDIAIAKFIDKVSDTGLWSAKKESLVIGRGAFGNAYLSVVVVEPHGHNIRLTDFLPYPNEVLSIWKSNLQTMIETDVQALTNTLIADMNKILPVGTPARTKFTIQIQGGMSPMHMYDGSIKTFIEKINKDNVWVVTQHITYDNKYRPTEWLEIVPKTTN